MKWSNIGHANFFIASPRTSPFLSLMSSTQPERYLFPAKPQPPGHLLHLRDLFGTLFEILQEGPKEPSLQLESQFDGSH